MAHSNKEVLVLLDKLNNNLIALTNRMDKNEKTNKDVGRLVEYFDPYTNVDPNFFAFPGNMQNVAPSKDQRLHNLIRETGATNLWANSLFYMDKIRQQHQGLFLISEYYESTRAENFQVGRQSIENLETFLTDSKAPEENCIHVVTNSQLRTLKYAFDGSYRLNKGQDLSEEQAKVQRTNMLSFVRGVTKDSKLFPASNAWQCNPNNYPERVQCCANFIYDLLYTMCIRNHRGSRVIDFKEVYRHHNSRDEDDSDNDLEEDPIIKSLISASGKLIHITW